MQADRRIYDLESDLHQALANPKRLEIIHTLAQGEQTTGALARSVEVTMPNLSQHLALLKQHGLVESRKEGLNVYYRLSSDRVLQVSQAARAVLAQFLTQQSALLRHVSETAAVSVQSAATPISSSNKSARIRQELAAGKSIKQIANELGLNYSFVYGVAKRGPLSDRR